MGRTTRHKSRPPPGAGCLRLPFGMTGYRYDGRRTWAVLSVGWQERRHFLRKWSTLRWCLMESIVRKIGPPNSAVGTCQTFTFGFRNAAVSKAATRARKPRNLESLTIRSCVQLLDVAISLALSPSWLVLLPSRTVVFGNRRRACLFSPVDNRKARRRNVRKIRDCSTVTLSGWWPPTSNSKCCAKYLNIAI